MGIRCTEWRYRGGLDVTTVAAILITGGIQVIVALGSAATDSIITFTNHGLEQAIGRDGGRGVSDLAMIDAITNPIQVVQQVDGVVKHVGQNAVVVSTNYVGNK